MADPLRQQPALVMLQKKDGAFDRQRQHERRRDDRRAIFFLFGTNQYADRGQR